MKYLWTMYLSLGSLFAFGQSASFTVKGRMSGWKDKETIYLRYTENEQEVADTLDVSNGVFCFSGKLKGVVNATIVLISRDGKGARDHRSFYMDGGAVTLTGTDSLKTARITGTKITAENETLLRRVNPLLDRLISLKIRASKMTKADQRGAEFKEIETEYKKLQMEITNTRISFIREYPKSLIALMVLKSVAGNPIDYAKAEPLFKNLAPELKKHTEGIAMAKALAIAKNTDIGMVLANFTSLDTLRRPLRLQDVVKKGKVTLVDFWASWCVPCRKENPNVVKAFMAFHDKGFNILSVSLDKTEAPWKKAIAADGMPWYHVSSLKYWDEPAVLQYGITGVPDNFLLDAEGKIVARGLRGDALYRKVEELMH